MVCHHVASQNNTGKPFKLPYRSHTLTVLRTSSLPGETSLVWVFTILIRGSVLQRKLGPYPAIGFQFIEVNHRTFLWPMTGLGIDMSVLAGSRFCWGLSWKGLFTVTAGKRCDGPSFTGHRWVWMLYLELLQSSIRLWMKSYMGEGNLRDNPT